MGGWIALLLALARPERVSALVGIAAAPDFTEAMWRDFPPEARRAIEETGAWEMPSDYADEPYLITRALIEDGRKRCLLDQPISIRCPVRLLQGVEDTAVPWRTALRIMERLESDDVEVVLIKTGDHRLSNDRDLARLFGLLDGLTDLTASRGSHSPAS
jgi:pimeloyl-ACP methyl ester carboxylesterase